MFFYVSRTGTRTNIRNMASYKLQQNIITKHVTIFSPLSNSFYKEAKTLRL